MKRSLVQGLVLGAAGLLALETAVVLAAWLMGPVAVAVAPPGPGAARGWVPVVARAAAGSIRGTVLDVIRTTPLTVDGIAVRVPPGVVRRVAAGVDARVEAAVARQLGASSRGRAPEPAVLRAGNAWLGHSAVWLSLGWGHLWVPVRVRLVRRPRD